MSMEENRLTHKVPAWNTRNPTSKTPWVSQLEPNNCNDKVVNHIEHSTQACREKGKVVMEEQKESGSEGDDEVVSETGRERLKRHREEVKGKVKIPENWGQEKLLKDWIDYTTFDALLLPRHRLIVAARDALIADERKARSQRLRIHTSC